MKFSDLNKGDWFTSPQDINAVFIKTDDTHAIHLGNHIVFEESPTYCEVLALPDEPVEFCSHFIWDEDNEDTLLNSSYDTNKSHKVEWYNEIPFGHIYKGRGNTWYRKLGYDRCVVLWSANPDTMGTIFNRGGNAKGDYTVCEYWEFNYPEKDELSEKTEFTF